MTLLFLAPKPMDRSFQSSDRAFHHFQQTYRFNDNPLELFTQQRHSEDQALSPGQPRSRGSSFTGSPTSPTSSHRPTVSQPSGSAARLQPGYSATGSAGAPQSTTSPVSPNYGQAFSNSMIIGTQYAWDGTFGDLSTQQVGGIGMSRNNSEK